MEKVLLVCFGLGGHTEYFAPRDNSYGHLDGYDRPDEWKPRNYDYSDTIFLNEIPAIKSNPMLSFNSPLYDQRLGENEVDRFADIAKDSMLADLINTNDSMASQWGLAGVALRVASKVPEYGGMDSVGRAIYVQFWKNGGARVGKLVNNVIQWE